MRSLKNSLGETIAFLDISVLPRYYQGEATNRLLNGKWVTQTIGEPAEGLFIQGAAPFDVFNQIMGYATTKEMLTIDNLNYVKTGFIQGLPEFEEAIDDDNAPYYYMSFEVVVVSSV